MNLHEKSSTDQFILFVAIYGNKPLPRITFVVVKKRHNTRFFAYDGRTTTNIDAGTVIDEDITHPTQFDFFLCSQGALFVFLSMKILLTYRSSSSL